VFKYLCVCPSRSLLSHAPFVYSPIIIDRIAHSPVGSWSLVVASSFARQPNKYGWMPHNSGFGFLDRF
jgi:hypothetical protein